MLAACRARLLEVLKVRRLRITHRHPRRAVVRGTVSPPESGGKHRPHRSKVGKPQHRFFCVKRLHAVRMVEDSSSLASFSMIW